MRKNYDLGPMEKTSKKKVIREGRGRVYNIKKRAEKQSLEMEPRKPDYCWELSCGELLLIGSNLTPKN